MQHFQKNRSETRIKPLGVIGDDPECGDQEGEDDGDQTEHRVGRSEMMLIVVDLVHHDDN